MAVQPATGALYKKSLLMSPIITFLFLPGLFIFLIGLFAGSFLGVLADRIQRNENVIKGRSYCESCKKELAWYDLIPLFSFLFLKGKCRYCGTKLSLFYPIIEISTGTLFVLTYIFVNFQFSIFNFQSINQFSIFSEFINLIYYLLMISSFIVIFFTDLKYGIIPDKIVFPAIIVSLFYLLFFNQQPARIAMQSVAGGSLTINLLSGVGALAFFVIVSYLFFFLTKKEGLGGGDIKLSFLLGLFLGFPNIIIALYIAFLTGAAIAIILILWKKKSFTKGSLPFGPFLVMGGILSLFLGTQIYYYALSFLGF